MSAARPRKLVIPLMLAALAAVAAACGGASAGTHAAAGVRATVKLRATSLGKVLVDARGRTLYLYTPDGRNKSACYGGCAASWPPLLTAGKPRAAAGAKAGLLGTAKRKDGKIQVTYKGHPLYFFAGDSKAGEENGEGYGGVWYAVSAAGAKVASSTTSASNGGTTTTTTPGAGYGYGGGGGG